VHEDYGGHRDPFADSHPLLCPQCTQSTCLSISRTVESARIDSPAARIRTAKLAQDFSITSVLCIAKGTPTEPAWQALYDVAAAQEGLFTTRRAAAAGYSDLLLAHHQKAGRITRIRRGIYRLVHFPAGEHEEVVAAWLWTGTTALISHQSALSLHGLSDALLAQVHLALPTSWTPRRLRVPKGLVLHFSDVGAKERT
jgi:hypothetical protein